jgi:hypothetical protein
LPAIHPREKIETSCVRFIKVILSRLVISIGENLEGRAEVPAVRGQLAMKRAPFGANDQPHRRRLMAVERWRWI